MRQRGRKGSAQLEVACAVAVVTRPDAPLDLTPEETDEWRAIVDGMPADWFQRETWPLLAQYCRHTVAARRVGQLLDAEMAGQEIDLARLDKLLAAQARESGALKALAASMRLAQQSSRTDGSSGTAKRNRTVKRLWE
jgi:hypothetical protein